jgi:phenylpropionate dioxygenase-like ring-hydroxylating dioxygenase large terminal subunit
VGRVGAATIADAPVGSLQFAPTVTASPAVQPSAAAADAAAEFQWTKQWYPVAVVEYLDPEIPHAFKVLGIDIVVWNDGAIDGATTSSTRKQRGKKTRSAGTWRAFQDACPHRLAPLSEGRVEETGELLCAYHAWRFDGSGACTAIPQSLPSQEASHRANPRASCHAYPTTVADGLLWVWPESGEDAALEAATLRAPNLIPELRDPALAGRVKMLPWNQRELPYGYDFFMENVHDPAHVTVSHHGIVGDRYTGPRPLQLTMEEPVRAQSGYKIRITPVSADGEPDVLGAAHSYNTFRPPSLLQITSEFTAGGKLILALYATPSRPGYCNHIGCQVLVKNTDGTMPPGLGMFTLPLPKWLLHVTSSLFLHQDAVFLHHQEKILSRGALGRTAYTSQPDGGEYIQSVFTPNVSDKGIITFRQWLSKYAGGGVPWTGDATLPPRSMDGARLFDVYDSHTKNCRYCLDALRNVRRAKIGAFVAAGLLVLAQRALGVVPSAVLAAGAAVVGVALGKLQDLFYKYEFSHAANH